MTDNPGPEWLVKMLDDRDLADAVWREFIKRYLVIGDHRP